MPSTRSLPLGDSRLRSILLPCFITCLELDLIAATTGDDSIHTLGCDLEYQEAKLNALEILAAGSHGRGSNLIVYWLEADDPLAQADILQAEVKGHELRSA